MIREPEGERQMTTRLLLTICLALSASCASARPVAPPNHVAHARPPRMTRDQVKEKMKADIKRDREFKKDRQRSKAAVSAAVRKAWGESEATE